jgi:hypothetical protein
LSHSARRQLGVERSPRYKKLYYRPGLPNSA